jgi:hypothetical protein
MEQRNMNNYLEVLKQMKAASQVSNETIAALTDHQLSAEQIKLMLDGCEDLQSKENLVLLEKGIFNACMLPLENLKIKLMQVFINRSSNLT